MTCAFHNLKKDDALWSFDTVRFTIELHATEDDMDPADSFEYPEDIETARSGNLHDWFCAVVLVRGENGDVIGFDTLGGCSYMSFEDFYQSHRDRDEANRNTLALRSKGRAICHYFPDMVSQAVLAARAELKAQRYRAANIKAP